MPLLALSMPIAQQLVHLGADWASTLLVVGFDYTPALLLKKNCFGDGCAALADVLRVLAGCVERVEHLLIRVVHDSTPMLNVFVLGHPPPLLLAGVRVKASDRV